MEFLLGKPITVWYSTNQTQLKLAGTVVYQTARMYHVKTSTKIVKLAKDSCVLKGNTFVVDYRHRALKKPLNKLKFTLLTDETTSSYGNSQ